MIFLTAVMMLGCGDGEGTEDASGEAVVAPTGVWQIDGYWVSDGDCDSYGDDLLPSLGEPFLFFTDNEFMGQSYVMAYSCDSVDDCADKEATLDSGGMISMDLTYTFTEDEGGGGMSGVLQSTGWTTGDGICEAPERSSVSLHYLSDVEMEIESRITIGDDYPEEDGYCTTDAAEAACEGKPCSDREFLTLTPA